MTRDTDPLAFDEGAEGEHAAHELGECEPLTCPDCAPDRPDPRGPAYDYIMPEYDGTEDR